MKKIIIILLLTIAFLQEGNAQTGLCDTGPCTFIEMITEYIGIVDATCPTPHPTHPYAVMVIVTYAVYDCNGTRTIVMNDPVFIDDRVGTLASGCTTSDIPPHVVGLSPITSSQIRDFIIFAINATVNNGSGATNGKIDVLFPGSCNSLVKLRFPAGAYFPQAPNDLGTRDTFFIKDLTDSYQHIPCGEACCKVTYEYRLITTENGLTHSKWIPTNIRSDGPPCELFPLPNYNSYAKKLEADYLDPLTGLLTKVAGTVIGQQPCVMMCPRFNIPPPPMFKTKSGSVIANSNLAFSAKPTLVENFITVESELKVKKVVIYDNLGKKTELIHKVNGDRINLEDLKTGIYYIQFILENEEVKTIKIFKQ